MYKDPKPVSTREQRFNSWNCQGDTEEPRLTVAEARDLAASFERGYPEPQPIWNKLLFSLQPKYTQAHFRT